MLWVIILTAVAVILSFTYYKISKRYRYWEVRGVKYIKPKFLVGNVLNSTLGKEPFYSELSKFYATFPNERYMGMYQFTTPILILRDPELIKSIYIKDFEYFMDHRSFILDGSDPVWNRSLVFLKGSDWKHMRSTLSPAFTSSKMRILFTLIIETVENYINYISENKVEKIELRDFSTRFTNDIIASVAFGIQIDSLKNKDNEFYIMCERFTTFAFREWMILLIYTLFPKLSLWLGVQFTLKRVRDFFYNIIMENIKIRKEKGIFRPDMISLLIEEQKKEQTLTNDEIIAQAFVFMFAGFDTVSNGLAACLYELSKNSECQTKLQQEIDDVLKENGKLSYEALMNMKYIDQVISETFRIWPPALGGDRVCTKAYTIKPTNSSEKALELNPGDLVWTSLIGIQNDPKYFPNPKVFDPERFNDSNKDKMHPYTYLPFGIGPRICIGTRLAEMEIKVLLFYLLNKYSIVAINSEPIKVNNFSFNLKLGENFWVKLESRK